MFYMRKKSEQHQKTPPYFKNALNGSEKHILGLDL